MDVGGSALGGPLFAASVSLVQPTTPAPPLSLRPLSLSVGGGCGGLVRLSAPTTFDWHESPADGPGSGHLSRGFGSLEQIPS